MTGMTKQDICRYYWSTGGTCVLLILMQDCLEEVVFLVNNPHDKLT